MEATEQIKKEYARADEKGRAMLERICGKDAFVTGNEAMEMFEEFCKRKKIDPQSILPYSKPLNNTERSINAYSMLIAMVEDRRNGWKPDFNNGSQRKWWPYFDLSGSGFAFATSYYVWTFTCTYGGSRLCLSSSDEAERCGREWLPIWREFISNN